MDAVERKIGYNFPPKRPPIEGVSGRGAIEKIPPDSEDELEETPKD